MFDLLSSAITGASLLAALAAVASVVMAIAKRWALSHTLARGAAIGALALGPIGSVMLVFAFGLVASADTTSKATQLARGIACVMNVGALLVPTLVISVPTWLLARRRLASPRRAPPAPQS